MNRHTITVYSSIFLFLFIILPVELFAQLEVMRTIDRYDRDFIVKDKWEFLDKNIAYAISNNAIYRWNGNYWIKMNISFQNDINSFSLSSIWALDEDNLYIVGESKKGMVWHRNGQSFNPMNSGSYKGLVDIWGTASDNIFAVGKKGTIVHYDGQYWNVMDSGTSENLNFVRTESPTNAFAVSSWGTIFQYNGVKWERYHEGPHGVLMDYCGINLGFPPGFNPCYYDENYSGGIGAAWPIVAHSINDICIEYSYGRPGYEELKGYYQFNGNDWQRVYSCEESTQSEKVTQKEINNEFRLNAIFGFSPNDIYSVGGGGQLLHFDGSEWSLIKTPVQTNLNDIHGSSNNNIIAVGDNGVIIRFDGICWKSIPSDIQSNLNSVFVVSENSIIITGDDGIFIQYENGEFKQVKIEDSEIKSFGDVWGVTENDIFVITDNNEMLLHYDGESWNTFNIKYDFQLNRTCSIINHNRIWGNNSEDIYLLSSYYCNTGSYFSGSHSPNIIHFDGKKWQEVSTSGSRIYGELNAIWGDSSGKIILASMNDAIVDYGYGLSYLFGSVDLYDQSWSNSSLYTKNPINDIWGDSDGNVYLVGDNGTILKWIQSEVIQTDVTPPTVLTTYPNDGADDVVFFYASIEDDYEYQPLEIRIHFSEDLDFSTINHQTFKVNDGTFNDVIDSINVDGEDCNDSM